MDPDKKWWAGPIDPDTALNLVLEKVEATLRAGDFEKARDLINKDFFQCWFGFQPTRFMSILNEINQHVDPDDNPMVFLEEFMDEKNYDQFSSVEEISATAASHNIPTDLIELAMSFQARLSGHPVQALERSRALDKKLTRQYIQPVFDTRNGWALAMSVQRGVSATLAGEFLEALAHFNEAQMHVPVPSMVFLHRDAFLRSALIEASFGDRERAQYLLDQSRTIPRTSSWTELTLDASEVLVEVLLEAENIDTAIKKLDALSLQDVGEMWPFYIIALNHTFSLSNKEKDLTKRMIMLSSIGFPKHDGEGLSGSVINVAFASLAAKKGHFKEAWSYLEKTDQNVVSTRLFVAFMYALTGEPKKAIELAYPIREKIAGLRKLELIRFAVLADAYFALGQDDEAHEILTLAVAGSPEFQADELLFFTPQVRKFAKNQIPGWPEDGHLFDGRLSASTTGIIFSPEEFVILQKYAQNKTTKEIAFDLFVSLQTLETMVQNIFKKLEVDSVPAAVIQAERKGLI